MLVAGEDGVDARYPRQEQRRVPVRCPLAAGDAGMAEGDDHVRLLAQRRQILSGGIDDVDGGRLAFEIVLVPLDDLRRHESR